MDMFNDGFDVKTVRGKLTALAPYQEVFIPDEELLGIAALLCNTAGLLPLVLATVDVVTTPSQWWD